MTSTDPCLSNGGGIGGGALQALLPGGDKARGGGLQGPLAIGEYGGRIAESRDSAALVEFAAVLSINLAVFNALPFPGLDGFQLGVLSAEAASRRRLPEKAREAIQATAAVTFLGAFSSVLISDAESLIRRSGGGAEATIGARPPEDTRPHP